MFAWAEHGFELAGEARHGQEALDLCERLQPDIIVTDIVMPVMDGLRLTRMLKERKPEYQVILLTCHSEFDYAREALSLGASDYLLKGTFRDQDLLNALNRAKGRIPASRVQERVETANAEVMMNLPPLRKSEAVHPKALKNKHSQGKFAAAAEHDLESLEKPHGQTMGAETLQGQAKMGAHGRQCRTPVYGQETLASIHGRGSVEAAAAPGQEKEQQQTAMYGQDKTGGSGGQKRTEARGHELPVAGHSLDQDDGKRYEIRHALHFIQAHLAEPFDLPVVAGHVGLSANYFGTLFRREIGERFQDYVKRQRLEKAAHLLRNSPLKVYEVAAEVGFPNYRYFTDVFFQQYGRSPREFRSSHG